MYRYEEPALRHGFFRVRFAGVGELGEKPAATTAATNDGDLPIDPALLFLLLAEPVTGAGAARGPEGSVCTSCHLLLGMASIGAAHLVL
jgi:hypothetical protein